MISLKITRKQSRHSSRKHGDSVNAANSDLDTTAALVVAKEIIGKEPVAIKAIPQCNIVCITGDIS